MQISSDSRQRCLKYRRRILDISQTVTAHIAPAFSCLEIVDTIYHDLMRKHDVFLMSKGHGCLAQYVILEDLGVLSLDGYCKGPLGAHPDRGMPGIEASTGSLGHGLGMAVGMAYAERLKGTDARVYVVISDGELQEGSTWEAVQMAANLKLNNLLLFVDLNDFGGLERISESHPAVFPVEDKFDAFGWWVTAVGGHDARALVAAGKYTGSRPLAVICSTVKGKGVSFMEHVPIWHYRSPNKNEYAQAIAELS